MMNALCRSGLTALADPIREQKMRELGDKDYRPNKTGFYELDKGNANWSMDFPRMNDGYLFKYLRESPCVLPVWDYKIVIMLRDPEEIRQSAEAFFGAEDFRFHRRWKSDRAGLLQYEQRMTLLIERLAIRRDCDVISLWYRDVIDDPHRSFSVLRRRGWPINVEQAASTVDPSLCRFRKELLTVGA